MGYVFRWAAMPRLSTMAPIWVMPPLWTQTKVPPYLFTAGVVAVVVVKVAAVVLGGVVVVVTAGVVVVVDWLQLTGNSPIKRIRMSATNNIFFNLLYPLKDLLVENYNA